MSLFSFSIKRVDFVASLLFGVIACFSAWVQVKLHTRYTLNRLRIDNYERAAINCVIP